jgi:GDPmannose 4,6-dehydratase
VCPNARKYFAASSEMFGTSIEKDDDCQRETTPMHPTSPYGCAKVLGFNLMRHYRAAYGLFAANGILFNHKSPRRGSNFVTQKVVKGAVAIYLAEAKKAGSSTPLKLGNMDSYRDWGHSRDYVRAIHLILQHDEPDDFVIATGETHSVRDMCEYVFRSLGLDYKDHVVQDPRLLRPQELPRLRGDASKAWKVLGWEPEYTFESLLDEMIRAELKRGQIK